MTSRPLSNAFSGVQRPTLFVDEQRARRNIARMAVRALAAEVVFRPHFKTHQSPQVAEWFRQAGVTAIAVSSLAMAEGFADHGWDDILIAFPVNLREADRIAGLAARVSLGVLLDSAKAADALSGAPGNSVKVWIEIDTGQGRTGLRWSRAEPVVSLAGRIISSRRLSLEGVLTHNGMTYAARNEQEILEAHRQSMERMLSVRDALSQNAGLPARVSIGDTPACSILESFPGADEIRPGNFVFYDLMQERMGSCAAEDIAVAVACPVVGIYPQRREIVICGGAVHLSKEPLRNGQGESVYGCLVDVDRHGLHRLRPECCVTALSQEHGTVRVPDPELYEIGDLVWVVPVHSCLTCDLHTGYRTFDGEPLEKVPRGF